MATATKPKKAKPPKASARKDNPVNVQYEALAKSEIKKAMTARGADWDALANNLHALGVEISSKGLENKISRGGFSAAFMLQCLEALEMNFAVLKR